jgi:hypothetical protein
MGTQIPSVDARFRTQDQGPSSRTAFAIPPISGTVSTDGCNDAKYRQETQDAGRILPPRPITIRFLTETLLRPSTGHLLDWLARKAVAPAPEHAIRGWTPFSLVIDAFLVRAAHDAVTHNNGEDALAIDELEDLAGDV